MNDVNQTKTELSPWSMILTTDTSTLFTNTYYELMK